MSDQPQPSRGVARCQHSFVLKARRRAAAESVGCPTGAPADDSSRRSLLPASIRPFWARMRTAEVSSYAEADIPPRTSGYAGITAASVRYRRSANRTRAYTVVLMLAMLLAMTL